MNDDSTHETRRSVLQKSAVAGSALTLGGVAVTGSAAAGQPDIRRNVEVTVENPCTGEVATDTDALEVVNEDIRTDNRGGQHVNIQFSGKARLVGEDSGQTYEASIHGTIQGYLSPDESSGEMTELFRFKVISRGSEPNFLAKLTAHMTINANGVKTVDTEYTSIECL